VVAATFVDLAAAVSLPFATLMLFFASAGFFGLSSLPPELQASTDTTVARNTPPTAQWGACKALLFIASFAPTHT
jgi:hypothetical protein